jgi:hypothetical protein
VGVLYKHGIVVHHEVPVIASPCVGRKS